MNLRKYLLVGLIILLILSTVIIISLLLFNKGSVKPSTEFSEFIRSGNLNDLSLTIYYLSPTILTRQPVSEADLADGKFEYRVTIYGSRLVEHIDLLNQIDNTVLIPVEHESRMNARLYYVFETKKNGKLFSVSMWGKDNSIFVNGIEVQESDIFYDVAKSFLPDDAVKELETYLNQ
ncbi:hypothetical protein [Paenibacillus sp. L3-i20]|uniref:hypothetical protein n=1 Tax=Paenibacillus sp. L3-i20 TaxID=2905833 RepID=UPI001EDEEB51|nr:hypothetical protein [Paenibacillus sp. L3-i20]GKU75958.1 hypothetical protein L3i20_v203550 [Paenibacillus sp. L3-i20]